MRHCQRRRLRHVRDLIRIDDGETALVIQEFTEETAVLVFGTLLCAAATLPVFIANAVVMRIAGAFGVDRLAVGIASTALLAAPMSFIIPNDGGGAATIAIAVVFGVAGAAVGALY